MIEKMKSSWLYYAAPYGKGGGTVWMRAATLFMALCGPEMQNIFISIILAGVICIGIGNQWMERMLHCTLSSEGLESGMKRIVQWVKKKY